MHLRYFITLVTLTCAHLAACRSGQDAAPTEVTASADGADSLGTPTETTSEADVTPDTSADDPWQAGRYLQVTLQRTPEGYAVLEMHAVDQPDAQTSELAGDHLLIARRGDGLAAVAQVDFPTEALLEASDSETGASSPESGAGETIALDDEQIATVQLPMTAAFDRLELLTPDGTLALTIPDPPFAPLAAASPGALFADEGYVPLPEYPGLRILYPQGAYLVPRGVRAKILGLADVRTDLTPAQLQRLIDALRSCTPAVLRATHTVIVVNLPNRGITLPNNYAEGLAEGTLLWLNADLFHTTHPVLSKRLERVVVHETAHILAGKLTARGTPFPGDATIGATLEHYGHRRPLGVSFTDTWEQLHRSAVDLGFAGDYVGRTGQWPSEDGARDGGFAKPYGAVASNEDIATYVERVRLGPNFEPTPQCARLQGSHTPHALSEYLPYAKILVLHRAGLLEDADLSKCFGAFAPPIPGDGIHLMNAAGEKLISLRDGLNAGFLQRGGVDMFAVLGSGPNGYHMSIEVRAPQRVYPIGLHALQNVNLATVDDPINGVFLGSDQSLELARGSDTGLVLFTTISPQRVEGLLFFLTLQNGSFLITDDLPLSTFRVTF